MNIVKSQWKTVERVVKTKDGRDAIALVALFFVGERVVSAKLLNVRILPRVASGDCPKICAEYKKSPAPIEKPQKISKIVSPYFDTFSFLVSQPTRAPAGN